MPVQTPFAKLTEAEKIKILLEALEAAVVDDNDLEEED